ncbi:intimal thickness related receptor [Baffinella frigidus]|nr:intimal thickness related receptor [Cryptophyta sp. CCMP2293]
MLLMVLLGVLFQYLSVLLQAMHGIQYATDAMHGIQYATDGIGLKALQGIGEVSDAASNIIIMGLLVAMAKGWSTTTAGVEGDVRLSKEWISSASLFLLGFFSMSVLERVGRAMDERYCYDSDLGVLFLVLRMSVYIYFKQALVSSLRLEEVPRRKEFLWYFGIAGSVWFVALPVAYLLSQFFNPWDQMKMVLGIGTCIHTAGLMLLVLSPSPFRVTFISEDN